MNETIIKKTRLNQFPTLNCMKMNYLNIMSTFSRLSMNLGTSIPVRNISTNINPLFFKATNVLLAEPLKKKKKIDPAIIKQKEEKRRRRLEKQIKRLEKAAMQLKQIEECEVPLKLIDERKNRLRKLPALSTDTIEERELLKKAWTSYKHRQALSTIQMIDRILASQNKALDELRMESEELYFEAIQPDPGLVPYSSKGPVSTPPIENYPSPDGEYRDITKKYD